MEDPKNGPILPQVRMINEARAENSLMALDDATLAEGFDAGVLFAASVFVQLEQTDQCSCPYCVLHVIHSMYNNSDPSDQRRVQGALRGIALRIREIHDSAAAGAPTNVH